MQVSSPLKVINSEKAGLSERGREREGRMKEMERDALGIGWYSSNPLLFFCYQGRIKTQNTSCHLY